MKDSLNILSDLRRMMDGYVGQTFTEVMRHRIRCEATDIMNTAYDEGQAAMAHLVCANAGTSHCRQVLDGAAPEIYEGSECRECNHEGGFEI